MDNDPLWTFRQVLKHTSLVVVLNGKRPAFKFSTEPQNDLDTKLHCITITTNLHMFLKMQLCMCFMERQERKIH